ncbi:MAG TPA: hypothetical protein VK507_24385 [Iamia sp.]|nr:hypothetical protein [Iamia sp.]
MSEAPASISSVVATLLAAGFVELDRPLQIAGIEFDFEAALLGPEGVLDLVLVVDLPLWQGDRLETQVRSVGRALDILRSRRSLTVVLVGATPSTEVHKTLAFVSRVLIIEPGSAESLVTSLRVLMPIASHRLNEVPASSVQLLKERLGAASEKPLTRLALAEAERGAQAVHDTFESFVRSEAHAGARPLDEDGTR